MSDSVLVNYIKISPNKTVPRRDKIRKITIHHMAGNLSVQACGEVFQSRGGSSNYGIDNNCKVGLYVHEKDRAWSCSSPDNDNQSVNIELANDEIGGSWHVADKVINKCIELCVDICKRNGIKSLNFTGDERGTLTMHCYFEPTECPGPYLKTKFKYIADEVNKRLNGHKPSGWSGGFPRLPSRGYYLKGDGYNTYTDYRDDIKLIQSFLNWAINAQLEIDGCYGPNTTRAVRAFQKVCNIKQDGSYGVQTLGAAKNFKK